MFGSHTESRQLLLSLSVIWFVVTRTWVSCYFLIVISNSWLIFQFQTHHELGTFNGFIWNHVGSRSWTKCISVNCWSLSCSEGPLCVLLFAGLISGVVLIRWWVVTNSSLNLNFIVSCWTSDSPAWCWFQSLTVHCIICPWTRIEITSTLVPARGQCLALSLSSHNSFQIVGSWTWILDSRILTVWPFGSTKPITWSGFLNRSYWSFCIAIWSWDFCACLVHHALARVLTKFRSTINVFVHRSRLISTRTWRKLFMISNWFMTSIGLNYNCGRWLTFCCHRIGKTIKCPITWCICSWSWCLILSTDSCITTFLSHNVFWSFSNLCTKIINSRAWIVMLFRAWQFWSLWCSDSIIWRVLKNIILWVGITFILSWPWI